MFLNHSITFIIINHMIELRTSALINELQRHQNIAVEIK